MYQRILVTGGNGTLGRVLVPRLQHAGHRLRISSRTDRPADQDDGLEWVQADLKSADGWPVAVQGIDTIVHLASTPFDRGADTKGTEHLIAAAKTAGVKHILFMSIVGVDKRDWFFYSAKRDCELLIEESGIPFSILRATQFHDFAHMFLRDIFLRLPIGFLPKNWRIQPIDTGEVAALLLQTVQNGPSGYLAEAGGPQILTFEELAEIWMSAAGHRRALRIPFPFLMGRAFSSGHNLTPDQRVGRITWEAWVGQNVAK